MQTDNAQTEPADPTKYGPYLDVDEEYNVPRTTENVDAVLKQCGGDSILETHGKETHAKVRSLIYEHWVLFDEKFRNCETACILAWDIDYYCFCVFSKHKNRCCMNTRRSFNLCI